MPSHIHHIATSVPEYQFNQDELRERMKQVVDGTDRDRRIIHQIYSRSGIETRHSVVNDFQKSGTHTLFFNGQGPSPGTQSRNDTYIREGRKLFVDVAKKLASHSEFNASEITHLITVSCTGFYAPGPDFDIIRALKLNPGIERYHLGFMGCYASIPALKLADQICRADEEATVMIVSVELCTLHFQANSKLDDLLSASVFADGGAGAIISSKAPSTRGYKIDGFASALLDKGENDMAWSIGDRGFNMILSSYIPDLLADSLEDFLRPVLKQYNISQNEIDEWGVHPGGRAILDKVQSVLSLPEHSLEASRSVLSKFGNMSSATILFVLQELLEQSNTESSRTIAMAFGPGLTLETALLQQIN
jgi:predicted naringenin-chalcone synthase